MRWFTARKIGWRPDSTVHDLDCADAALIDGAEIAVEGFGCGKHSFREPAGARLCSMFPQIASPMDKASAVRRYCHRYSNIEFARKNSVRRRVSRKPSCGWRIEVSKGPAVHAIRTWFQ